MCVHEAVNEEINLLCDIRAGEGREEHQKEEEEKRDGIDRSCIPPCSLKKEHLVKCYTPPPPPFREKSLVGGPLSRFNTTSPIQLPLC